MVLVDGRVDHDPRMVTVKDATDLLGCALAELRLGFDIDTGVVGYGRR